MNLSFVLDVAIGLIFTYLVLSLLASEIQELLATLLQWRAIHLQRSIEMLLTGGEGTRNEEPVKNIVNDLYNNPLIKNINQEAKEGIEAGLRQFTWKVTEAYEKLTTKRATVFGKDTTTNNDRRSGPSYIPAETFSTTLLENLKIPQLAHSLSKLNILKLKEIGIRAEIKEFISDENLLINENTRKKLEQEADKLEHKLEKVFKDFKNERATLINSINRMRAALNVFIENCKRHFQQDEAHTQEDIESLISLRDNIFPDDDPKKMLARVQPSLILIIDTLDKNSNLYTELGQYIECENNEIRETCEEIKQEIENVTKRLPKSVIASLSALARRTQIKVSNIEDELNQFKKEVEVWFERSMERSSGVYKRNAKGVAFFLGFLLAVAINADTFYIVGMLSKDTSMRTAIITNSSKLVPECLSPVTPKITDSHSSESTNLDCFRKEIEQVLDSMSLPIGWGSENLPENKSEYPLQKFLAWGQKFLGWVISGFAISMGASFWFELLGKIINVRNTGAKPESSQEARMP